MDDWKTTDVTGNKTGATRVMDTAESSVDIIIDRKNPVTTTIHVGVDIHNKKNNNLQSTLTIPSR
jgi:hypothetical protein